MTSIVPNRGTAWRHRSERGGPMIRNIALTFALAMIGAASQASAAPPAALVPITFVTDWKAQAEHGGFYEALALGFYKARGLDVRIVEGGPSVNVPQLLAGGGADFGIGSNGFIPLTRVRGMNPLEPMPKSA